MSLSVELAVSDERWSTVADLHRRVEEAVEAARRLGGATLAAGAEVSILLCDDATVQALNRDWRGLDKPTNVLSFPTPSRLPIGQRPLLGDIAVAFDTARREAERDGVPLADHLSHLVVHGVLHLLGHDHENAAEAEAMEALETRVLATLGIPDPYAGTVPLAAGAR